MIRPLTLLTAAFVGFIASGCGGGGGLIRIDFDYVTNWAGSPTGRSQVVTISIEGEGIVGQFTLNNTLGGSSTATFLGLAPGDYILEADYFSQTDGNGVLLGELADRVRVTRSNRRFDSIVGQPVDRVEVHPSAATIKVQQSIRLFAVGYDASDTPTFVGPNKWTWEALSSNVAVDQQGIVVGQAVGSAQVRATHVDSGRFNSSVITVTPFTTVRSKWTVMVFLNAANDLDQWSDLNVNQMERATSADVRFVLQWKRSASLGYGAPWSGTRRYLTVADSTPGNGWSNVKSELVQDMGEGVDMGSAATLREFITWSQTYYPADRYVLVIWNHGSGWRSQTHGGTRGFSFDDERGTYIRTWELNGALQSPERIDVLSWDASLMQMLEVGYEARNRVDYIVGAEVSPPEEGLPYDLVFNPLKQNPDQSTEAMLEHFGTGMLAYYGNTRRITQSSLRTSAIPSLAAAVSQLGQQLIANNGFYDPEVSLARATSETFRNDSNGCFVDLVDLAFNLKALIGNAGIDAACDAVMAAVAGAVVHEHHNNLAPNAHGVSIEFGDRNRSYWNDYNLLQISADTLWDDWLRLSPP